MARSAGQAGPPTPGCGLQGKPFCGNWPDGAYTLRFAPLSEAVRIELSGEPALATHLCVGPPPSVASVPFPDCIEAAGTLHAGCPDFDRPPIGTKVACSSDGTAFAVLWTAPPTAYLCQYPSHVYGSGVRPPGSPAPAGWPCP
ncbi:MAG: hypothetical protein JNJ46_33650 [Myxococcales bacterium]|nr:hypothetical protein [Myxococcales bacterium]